MGARARIVSSCFPCDVAHPDGSHTHPVLSRPTLPPTPLSSFVSRFDTCDVEATTTFAFTKADYKRLRLRIFLAAFAPVSRSIGDRKYVGIFLNRLNIFWNI